MDAALAAALSSFRAAAPQRHSAEVTADRIGDHLDHWPGRLNGTDRDAIARIRDVLQQIAAGA